MYIQVGQDKLPAVDDFDIGDREPAKPVTVGASAFYMRSLLGWLETRLARNILIYIELA